MQRRRPHRNTRLPRNRPTLSTSSLKAGPLGSAELAKLMSNGNVVQCCSCWCLQIICHMCMHVVYHIVAPCNDPQGVCAPMLIPCGHAGDAHRLFSCMQARPHIYDTILQAGTECLLCFLLVTAALRYNCPSQQGSLLAGFPWVQ